ncbi:MAG: hypothetical protein ACRDQZ_22335, partial [Mycobacteriales bacterium]
IMFRFRTSKSKLRVKPVLVAAVMGFGTSVLTLASPAVADTPRHVYVNPGPSGFQNSYNGSGWANGHFCTPTGGLIGSNGSGYYNCN